VSAAGDVAAGISRHRPPVWQLKNGPATSLHRADAPPPVNRKPPGRPLPGSQVGSQTHRPWPKPSNPCPPPQDTRRPCPPAPSWRNSWRLFPSSALGTTIARDRKRLLRTLIPMSRCGSEPDRSKYDRDPLAHRRPSTAQRGPPLPPGPQCAAVPGKWIWSAAWATTDTRYLAGPSSAPAATATASRSDVPPFMDPSALQDPGTQTLHPGDAASPSRQPAGLRTAVIYYWLKAGQLTARRGAITRLCHPWTSPDRGRRRARITQSGHLTPPPAAPALVRYAEAADNAACRPACYLQGVTERLTNKSASHPEHSHRGCRRAVLIVRPHRGGPGGAAPV